MSPEPRAGVGLIGLGNMGAPIARNLARSLAKSGSTLVVHDRDVSRSAGLADCTQSAASARELAARCGRTLVLVATGSQLADVLFGENGIVAGARAGDTVVCLSTVDPVEFLDLHARCRPPGIALFDAPVSGGVEGAVNATLSIMVGASAPDLERCRDLFEAIATKVFHVGDVGQGLAMKLVNNMLVQVNMVAVCEALALARKAGLDLAKVYDVVRASTGNSVAFERRTPRVIARDFESGGTVAISYKDQGLEVEFARKLGVPLLLGAVSHQVYGMAMNAGLAQKDAIAVIQLYERMAGLSCELTPAAAVPPLPRD